MEKKDYLVSGRIWVQSGDGAFLGSGRVELLKKIKEYGSITQAAKSMNMAYRHAWRLIDSMNTMSAIKLVSTKTGGKKGGGAFLTEEGEKAIHEFDNLEKAFNEFLQEQSSKIVF